MPKDFVRTVGKQIGPVGGKFMLDPSAGARGQEVGLDFFEYYALGRAGVLGDVDGSVVGDAFYFFEPSLVERVWNSAKDKMDPRACVEHYTETCRIFGRERLSGVGELDGFAKLAERVVQSADDAELPLFAEWRKVPLPDDAPARAYQLIHVLREQRGGAHVNAVRAAGIEPIQAISINSPHMAAIFGYPAAIEDVEPFRAKVDAAEEATDAAVAPAFAVLDEGEQELFAKVMCACADALG